MTAIMKDILKRGKRMDRSDNRIIFRADDEIRKMLEELVQVDKDEAKRFRRLALNKSQIIIQAIKEYYAARINGKTQNAYIDLVDARLTQILDGYFSAERAHIINESKQSAARDMKIELMLRLILMGTDLNKREDLVRKLLSDDAAFEKPIADFINKTSGR